MPVRIHALASVPWGHLAAPRTSFEIISLPTTASADASSVFLFFSPHGPPSQSDSTLKKPSHGKGECDHASD